MREYMRSYSRIHTNAKPIPKTIEVGGNKQTNKHQVIIDFPIRLLITPQKKNYYYYYHHLYQIK